MKNPPALSLRVHRANPDHHLFCNNGMWWIHYSVRHDPGLKSRRERASLGTRCVLVARERRDVFFSQQKMPAASILVTEVAA